MNIIKKIALGIMIFPQAALAVETIPALAMNIRVSEPAPAPLGRPLPTQLPRPIGIPQVTIDGPNVRLPFPQIDLPQLPGAVIRVTPVGQTARLAQPVLAAKQPVFAQARASFTNENSQPADKAQLDAGFDGAKADAKASTEDAVRVPKKKKKQQGLTLPEYDLLGEIGVR
jgi:hypothetical protein